MLSKIELLYILQNFLRQCYNASLLRPTPSRDEVNERVDCSVPDQEALGPIPPDDRPYGQTAERYFAALKMED